MLISPPLSGQGGFVRIKIQHWKSSMGKLVAFNIFPADMLLSLPELSKSDPQPNMHEYNVFSRFSELFTRLKIVGFYQIIACVLPSSYFWTTSNLDHLLLFSFTNITIPNFFTHLLLFPNRPIQTGRVQAGCVFECSTVFVNIFSNRHSGRYTSQTARLFLAFWTRGVLLFQYVGHIYSGMLIYPLWSGLASVDCLDLLEVLTV